MKKIFYLPLFFLSYYSIAQCPNKEPTDVVLSPKGIMNDINAQTRIDIYRKNKNPEIPGTRKKTNSDSILYSPCGFLRLLQFLDSPKYDGLRIYFASNTDDKKQLMLVFVPTYSTTENTFRIHKDDTDACSIIVNDTFNIIKCSKASEYVKAFDNNQLKYFTINGQNHHSRFTETNSLWYDASLLKRGVDPSDKKSGLVSYLQYLINSNNIDALIANFGGFEHTSPIDYEYQLTLVFDFYKKGGVIHPLFGTVLHDPMKLFNKPSKKDLKEYLSGDKTDTGVPCPPPPTGQTCPGAQLPQ